MTRADIRRRLDTIAKLVKPPTGSAKQVASLEGLDLKIYRQWEMERQALSVKLRDQPGALYQAELEGTAPQLPAYLDTYIFGTSRMTTNMTLKEIAEIYDADR